MNRTIPKADDESMTTKPINALALMGVTHNCERG